jgi:FMN-dependent NADH-azoreductase
VAQLGADQVIVRDLAKEPVPHLHCRTVRRFHVETRNP